MSAEHTVIRADEVQEGFSVRLPESQHFRRIDNIGADELGRVVLSNGWGSCPLRPDELVDIEAVTGLKVPSYLREFV
ncbi:MAG: hypothetical protein ACRDPE_23495 [Solirubrobacterales bacterium]